MGSCISSPCSQGEGGEVEGLLPADAQRPEDVPLWSYFGREVPDHNRNKIARIRFLTCFGSAMSDLHLTSGNRKISLKNLFYG